MQSEARKTALNDVADYAIMKGLCVRITSSGLLVTLPHYLDYYDQFEREYGCATKDEIEKYIGRTLYNDRTSVMRWCEPMV